jgi:hypothetical protein
MHRGSCLCGAIAYELDCEIEQIIYCHCSRCRKSNGSTFATVTPISASNFKVIRGADILKTFRSEVAGVDRIFCSNCGSPIIGKRDSIPGIFRLRIGTIDTQLTAKVSSHIFVGSKAEWDEIHDDMPQYLERS